MKVLLVQPSRLQADGTVYKNKTRWLLGMTLPYVAALTPPGVDVSIKDDLYEDVPYSEHFDLVGLTCMSHQASRAYQIAAEFRRRGVPVVIDTPTAPDVQVIDVPDVPVVVLTAFGAGFTWGSVVIRW